MNKLRAPETLVFEGNLAEQWDRWKQQFEQYITITESDKTEENTKTSIFVTCIWKQGLEIYNKFTFTDDNDKMKVKPLMDQFEAYCKPRKNITLTTSIFHLPPTERPTIQLGCHWAQKTLSANFKPSKTPL